VEEKAAITIIDMSGKIVYQGKLSTGSNLIDIKNYRKGLYFFKVNGDNINFIKKEQFN